MWWAGTIAFCAALVAVKGQVLDAVLSLAMVAWFYTSAKMERRHMAEQRERRASDRRMVA